MRPSPLHLDRLRNIALMISRKNKVFILMAGMLAAGANAYAFNGNWLQQATQREEEALNARIGVAVIDKESGMTWSYRGDEAFPINSTHKAYLCAALLEKVDQKQLALSDRTTLSKRDLVAYSPITETLLPPQTASNAQLCEAAVSYSDNTAANKVLEKIGGVDGFNGFMRSIGDQKTRLDRKEPELNEGTPGDPRDTTTPVAAVRSLDQIFFSDHLSRSSKSELKTWMVNDKVAADLLRKSLPAGWDIADKTGAGGYGSRSIVAVVYPRGKKPLLVSIYITQTKATLGESNAAIARMGAILFKSMQ
ncbi:class A beta-lactamase [Ralstonia insidiosa]|nr:class A beta-lactamase [Ralstonia insidiosa]